MRHDLSNDFEPDAEMKEPGEHGKRRAEPTEEDSKTLESLERSARELVRSSKGGSVERAATAIHHRLQSSVQQVRQNG